MSDGPGFAGLLDNPHMDEPTKTKITITLMRLIYYLIFDKYGISTMDDREDTENSHVQSMHSALYY